MKIKKIPSLRKVIQTGHWENGRFFADKVKATGRLPQLNKRDHKVSDSEAVAAWKQSDNEPPSR